jgi:hypothetical protein
MMIAHRRIVGLIAAPALSAILNVRRRVQAAACDAMKALVAIHLLGLADEAIE